MTRHTTVPITLPALDAATRSLVLVSAAICGGSEAEAREALTTAHGAGTNADWVEEVLLQSYLFAGFPRALNAMREWRRISGRPAPTSDAPSDPANAAQWVTDGERTCATVYGEFYERLRHNITGLHVALDRFMITDGYGKVLSRPALDLARRELCVVAACAVQRQDRQLHSHLHGALNAGASASAVTESLDLLRPHLGDDDHRRYSLLWRRVRGDS